MMGLTFEQISLQADENFPRDLRPKKASKWVIRSKIAALPEISPNEMYILADTLVSLRGKILEKPETVQEAEEMIRLLMGNWHTVITALAVCTHDRKFVFIDKARVFIDEFSDEEIKEYLQSQDWKGKAGGYGIQEAFGTKKIPKIKGSFFTVMGLPTHLLYKCLVRLSKEYSTNS